MLNNEFLQKYYFPVKEDNVYVPDTTGAIAHAEGFKAIVREDNGHVIHVAKETYKLVRNQQVIESGLEELERLGFKYQVDENHSFVDAERMRLSLVFPDIKIRDNGTDINMSMYLHNSYNESEGVRAIFGAIRSICTNGMIIGTLLGKYYRRHTQGFQIAELEKMFNTAFDKLPQVQARIEALKTLYPSKEFLEEAEKAVGKKMMETVQENSEHKVENSDMWKLYNAITYVISHAIMVRQRARYQMAVSKLFKL